ERLRADHAHVSGPGERGRPAEAARLCTVARRAARGHIAEGTEMTSVTYHDVRLMEPAKTRNYLNVDYGALSWLLTKDHKRIGILYMISISIMFILGGFFAMMMRLELLTPEGDLLTSDTYNKFFTLHGIVMIFF